MMIEHLFESLEQARSILPREVENLDPEVLEPTSAVKLVEVFSQLERLSAAGKAPAARRVSSSGVWRSEGDRSPAHFIARTTGTSVGHAVGVLETAHRLRELPETDKAVREGKLSEVQSMHIASAAAASPSAEGELLGAAETEGLNGLRERCARVRAQAAPDEVSSYEAVRRRRRLRHWTDEEGAFRLDGLLTPDAGAVVLVALEPHREQIFRRARKAGLREPYEAYAADALVEMAEQSGRRTGEGVRSGPGAMVHVRVDRSALVRGSCSSGEVCEIPGVGPIPVATARALSADAILSAIVTDGVDVKAVAHLGRTIPAHLRTALLARDQGCVVPGCDVKDHLEIDHIHEFGKGGPTRLSNLSCLCRWHHYLKTYCGYRLSGGPGAWCWEGSDPGRPPDGPSPPRDRRADCPPRDREQTTTRFGVLSPPASQGRGGRDHNQEGVSLGGHP